MLQSKTVKGLGLALILCVSSQSQAFSFGAWGSKFKSFCGTTKGKVTLGAAAVAGAAYLWWTNPSKRDINLVEKTHNNSSRTAVLFAHGMPGGIPDPTTHGESYIDMVNGYRLFTFCFPGAPESVPGINRHCGLASKLEVNYLKDALRQLGERNDIDHIYLYGVSRGASTVVNLMKEANLPHINKIKGFIVESPFGSVNDIICNMVCGPCLGLNPLWWLGHGVVKCIFNQYVPWNQPNHFLNNVNNGIKDKPIYIVYSNGDGLIPAASSASIVQGLQNRGCNSVTENRLIDGEHCQLAWQYQGNLKNWFENNSNN